MSVSAHAQRSGMFYMLAVIAIWGAFLPVGKSALAVVDPYWLTAMRFGTAACAFIAMLVIQEGHRALRTEGRLPKIALLGSFGFAGFGLCLFEGLRLSRPETAAMILALGPILTAVVQWWRSRRRPDNLTLTAIAGALVGELLVITAGDLSRLNGGDALGNGLVFLAALFWLAYTLGGQEFPHWSPLRYSALSCAPGTVAIFVAVAIATLAGHSRPPQAAQLLTIWPQLVFIILCVSIFGILFWNIAVARIGPLTAGLFANFVPVVTYAIALAQGRQPEALELAGAAIVVLALIANNLHQSRQSRLARSAATAAAEAT